MANLIVLPRQLAMASAAFAPNTLYFYEPGTSTPKAVTDADGDSLGTEVPADAFGRYPAIYGTGLFKVVEKTAAGVTLSTDDNVAGFETGSGNGSLRADLASETAGKGAALVALPQGGTVRDAIKYITPQMIDSSAGSSFAFDSSTAFQAACASALVIKRTVILPPGDYTLANIDLSSTGGYRGISIIADDKAFIQAPDTSTDIFDISGQRRFSFTGGTFKKARRCFSSTNTLPSAYCRFSQINFFPDSASDIGAGFYGDSFIGNVWSECLFGWDQVADGIDTCVDFLTSSANQTNVNHFDHCVFINFKDYGVNFHNSSYSVLNNTFNDCWFEDSAGIGVYGGTNVKGLTMVDCYCETVGGTDAPFKFSGAVGVHIVRPNFHAANVIPAWIAASNTEITVEDAPNVTLAGFPLIALTNMPVGKVRLIDNILTPTGTPTYKAALFSIDDTTKEHQVEWSVPRNSSLTTGDDKFLFKSAAGRYYADGYLRHACAGVALASDLTWYTVATLTLPGATSGCRVTVDFEGIHQGIGVAAALLEVFVTRSGGAAPTITSIRSSTVGGTITLQVVASGNDAIVQVQRNGGSNTTVAPLVCVHQGDNDINSKRVTIA